MCADRRIVKVTRGARATGVVASGGADPGTGHDGAREVFRPEDLATRAFELYEAFRPEIPSVGAAGAGLLDVDAVLALRSAPPRAATGQGTRSRRAHMPPPRLSGRPDRRT